MVLMFVRIAPQHAQNVLTVTLALLVHQDYTWSRVLVYRNAPQDSTEWMASVCNVLLDAVNAPQMVVWVVLMATDSTPTRLVLLVVLMASTSTTVSVRPVTRTWWLVTTSSLPCPVSQASTSPNSNVFRPVRMVTTLTLKTPYVTPVMLRVSLVLDPRPPIVNPVLRHSRGLLMVSSVSNNAPLVNTPTEPNVSPVEPIAPIVMTPPNVHHVPSSSILNWMVAVSPLAPSESTTNKEHACHAALNVQPVMVPTPTNAQHVLMASYLLVQLVHQDATMVPSSAMVFVCHATPRVPPAARSPLNVPSVVLPPSSTKHLVWVFVVMALMVTQQAPLVSAVTWYARPAQVPAPRNAQPAEMVSTPMVSSVSPSA